MTGPLDVAMLATLGGIVRGDPSTQCVWIELADGSEASILWPRRYSARFAPLMIFDDELRLVAREGESLEFTGGSASLLTNRPVGLPEACRHGAEVWLVGAVQRAGGAAP